MFAKTVVRGLLAAALLASAASAQADVLNMPSGETSLQFVTVGDPGNAADSTGYGSVPYAYQMGTYDVTTAQYTAFLNAVARTGDPYGLYNSWMPTDFATFGITQHGSAGNFTYSVTGTAVGKNNMPMFEVSWGNAVRFCNWLQNGQPTGVEGPGTTETGAYTLNGATTDLGLMAVTRNSTAIYFLPTENEWYKAAYYVGGGTNAGYWAYPTKSNTTPSNVLSATGTNNANFWASGSYTDPTHLLTPVGSFADSPGPYGTYDMGGNVFQWNETAVTSTTRGAPGGSWGFYSSSLSPSGQYNAYNSPPSYSNNNIGFRVARSEVAEWASAVSGNWSDSTKWPGGVPNAVGVGAAFIASTNAAVTVTLDSPQTVGTLLLGSGTPGVGYTLSGSGSNTLTLNNSGSGATISVTDGSHVINAPVVLADNLAVTTGSTNPWTLSFGTASSITGSGYSLTMNGTGGTLILSGSNTYSGGTTVNAGTLLATNTAALPGYSTSGSVTVAGGSVLAIRTGGTAGWNGSQIASLAASATWTDNTSTLGIDTTNGNFTYGGSITEALTLSKSGANALTLTGANTYSGDTIISSGTLILANPLAVQNSTVNVRPGAVLSFAASNTNPILGGLAGSTFGITSLSTAAFEPVTLNVGGNGQSTAYGGKLSGAGGLSKQGPGTLTLTAPSNYSGPTIVNGGTLKLSSLFRGNGSLVGFWSGNGNASDSTGNNPGTWVNGVSFAAGRNGQLAFSFNGASYVQAGTKGLPTGNQDRTLDLWFNEKSPLSAETFLAGYGAIGGFNTTYALGIFNYDTPPNGVAFSLSQWGGPIVGPTIQDGRWYNLAVTTSGGGSTLYLDGTEVASGSVPIYTPGNSAFYIGTTDNGNGSTSKMNGLIQDVAIFNTALSQSEIQALMASGISGSLPTNTAVTIAASGTLDLSGGSQQVASLTGAGTVINSSNMDAASVLTLRATGGSTTFSGTILGGGTLGTISLVMSGSGTQVLAGSLLGPGSVTVNAGTLILSGSDNYTGGTDVVGGTLIATNSQSLPGGTSLTVGTGGTFIFDPSASGSVVTNLAAAVAVPEPSTVVLLSVGAIGLLGRAWRRRKQFLRPKTESGGILRDLGVCVPFNTQSLSGLRL